MIGRKTTRLTGIILVSLFGAVMIFQFLLALGLPIKGAVWGGKFDSDPEALRIVSLVSGFVLAFLVLIICGKIGIIRLIKNRRVINGVIWFFAVYLMLITVANLFSPGTIERLVMAPLSFITSILCVITARGPFAEDLKKKDEKGK